MSDVSKPSGKIDKWSKIATVFVAVFAAAQYSIDIYRSKIDSRRLEAISYIERFAEDEMLNARMELLQFWRERGEFAELVSTGAVSADNYGFFLIEQLDKEETARAATMRIGYFLDELYFCYQSRTCDRSMVLEYFCPQAIGQERGYFRYLREHDARLIGRDLYTGAKELSSICLDLENSAQSS
ncbi:hypothetical protein [Psychromarinibacter sp. S121]|uniref:hypothetical protein n=1 Tax=Psychromarinibacter sp. S121 TaxID=3415127 RepID=UPI003C7EC1D0